MKKIKNTKHSKTLHLDQETVKLLTDTTLENVHGGRAHTSFSCPPNLCTTH